MYTKNKVYFSILIFIYLFVPVAETVGLQKPNEILSEKRKHPITHFLQNYFFPSDCEDGDNIGRINILWSEKHFNDRSNTDYRFTITKGNTNNAFNIDKLTGEITIQNSSKLRTNHALEILITIDNDSAFTVAEIKRIDKENIIYLDSRNTNKGNGSRSAPYRSFKEISKKEISPGKYFLYRRGREFTDHNIVVTNKEADDRITFGSWGKGALPVINGGNSKSRFVTLGSVYYEKDIDKAAFNVDFSDLHFKNFSDNVLRLTRHGKNFNFQRLYFENSEATNGLLYLMANYNANQLYESNIYIRDIELQDYSDRGIKIERGGVIVENIKSKTDKHSPKAPVSPTMMPNVMMRYVDAESNGGTGPNLRQYNQNIEWAYLKGFERAVFISPTANADGSYGPWLLNRNYIQDVIIDGTTTSHGIFFEPAAGSENVAENVNINRVIIKNTAKSGIAVANGTKNLKISYCLILGSGEYGIRVDDDTEGTVIHNVTIIDSKKLDINAQSATEVVNSIFLRHSGKIKCSNCINSYSYFLNKTGGNFRPKINSPIHKSGTRIGYLYDIKGKPVSSTPSIGSYED